MIRSATLFVSLSAAILGAAPALAQSGCPADLPARAGQSLPQSLPMPAIVSYSVRPSRAPADPGEERRWAASPHAASVVGGDATSGNLVISITLSDAIRADCPFPVLIVDRAFANQNSGSAQGQVVTLTTGPLLNSTAPRANGTTQLSWTIPTRTVARETRLDRLALRMGPSGALHPLTITLLPPPAPIVTVHPINNSFHIRVSSAMPLRPELDDADREVSLVLSPTSPAAWVGGRTSGLTTITSFDDRFTPSRATAELRPAANPTGQPAQVTVRYAGHSIPVNVAIPASAPPPPPPPAGSCQPVALFTARAGAIHVGIGNSGRAACPAMNAQLTPGGAAPVWTSPIPAGARAPAPAPVAAPLARVVLAGWQGVFTLTPASVIAPRVSFTLTLTATSGATHRFSYQPSAAELALLRRKPGT